MIPVVEGDYLVGIISFQNLMRKLTALSLRRAAASLAIGSRAAAVIPSYGHVRGQFAAGEQQTGVGMKNQAEGLRQATKHQSCLL